ncbi:hypothetical protein Back11_26370 [Paenibacillus baekrokdamisoli]|uniref:Uncharacterized protein n=1 Tax=Paenibacillus baekrokdamisoli TaxID=1712516 RepID=A0A3G9IST5_9BACL|nr:hypothetical protein [Paenibacillus baekrokdamisoli]MBB3070287.1 hypothetical protein [Paenibacillus baekrokdamisoli]BBH21292.1 hypothetical protein Back11_26370 [Paenibacillus baekrokdamisoli]
MEEPKQKRPIFTPIVLLLLTFSVTANLFLFTRSIQSNQNELADRGFAVMDTAKQTKLHVSQVLTNVQALLDTDDIGKRLAAKSALIAAFNEKRDLVRIIDEAAITNEKPLLASPKRNAAEFLEQVDQSLQAIGNHEGSLTDAERAYLKQVFEVYTKLQAAVDSLNYKTISRTTALTVLLDDKWVIASKKMLEIMNEPDNVTYKP